MGTSTSQDVINLFAIRWPTHNEGTPGIELGSLSDPQYSPLPLHHHSGLDILKCLTWLTFPIVNSFILPSLTISSSEQTTSFCWSGILSWHCDTDLYILKRATWLTLKRVTWLTFPIVTSFILPSLTISSSEQTTSFCWSGILSWHCDTDPDPYILKRVTWLTFPMVTSFILPSLTISSSEQTTSFCWSGILSWHCDTDPEPYTSDRTREIWATPIFCGVGLDLEGLLHSAIGDR